MNQSGSGRWPRWVYSQGSEPDPRFTLANERTFLAWIRTSLGLLAGAAAIQVFELDVATWVVRSLAILLAVSALGCAIYGWTGWSRTERALRRGDPLPSNAFGAALVAAVVLAGVFMVLIGGRA